MNLRTPRTGRAGRAQDATRTASPPAQDSTRTVSPPARASTDAALLPDARAGGLSGSPATAVVTGGSSGIGEAFAWELAARGHDLVLVARRPGPLEDVAVGIAKRHGVLVETLAADITVPAERARVEARLADPDRPVEVLVNAAGTMGRVGPLALQDAAAEDHKIELNAAALVRLTRAALPGMVARRSGTVLNLASVAAFTPAPGGATYAATKAFVTTFSRAVREEVGPLGVRVIAVCPGATRTAGREAKGAHRGRMGPVLDASDVVRKALAAAAAGRPECVPGAEYRLRVALARHVPGLYRRLFQRGWQERTARALAGALTKEVPR
ncbi:SDR family NAD(P)-dependent oxidoreductase [Actinomadura rupiterrae]|uniref:SDR family NAD(P)-dependent oxidoreductase n=1 Tax=Actinomadura rupiterrae TaxID=559627 RepID=UPI0020A2B3FA|nr:SDR family NAD(P)-dependent oxidoreductase [Actinomadura rupiterrae]MCP2341099.1 hypothetical protein [Actinomadura rupiterrae]